MAEDFLDSILSVRSESSGVDDANLLLAASPPLDLANFARMFQAEQLDTLQALFPSHKRSLLAKYLAASNGNVERAFAAIERGEAIVEADGSRKRQRTKVESEGIAGWVRKEKQAKTEDVLVLSDSDNDKEPLPLPSKAGKSAFDLLKPSKAPVVTPQPVPTHVNLPPLTVSSPALVAKHTNGLVTLVEDALPPELAARLYVKMVKESIGEGEGDRPCESGLTYTDESTADRILTPFRVAKQVVPRRPRSHIAAYVVLLPRVAGEALR